MNAIHNPGLASVLQDFDSDRETARKRAVRAPQRIVGVAFGALAVFLAWVIVADARDLASGAEARLVPVLVPLVWWDLIERSAAGKTGGRPVGRF